MIGRLAELLVRLNPMAREALRLTYSHLFMDEFQDTTQVQYDLVKTIFRGSNTVITAVGDNKQQIMRWAMAMDDPFAAFDADFVAARTPLFNNYRSSPELVRIQHALAIALDIKAVKPVSMAKSAIDGESCAIWDFSSPQIEAQRLAAFVASEMETRKLGPRDFVLLIRQRADRYAAVLEPAFEAAGLSLRNEAAMIGAVPMQDLLSDEASQLIIGLLRLATGHRAGRYWSECQEALAGLWGIGPEDEHAQARLARDLDDFALGLAKRHPTPPGDRAASVVLIREILKFIGADRLLAAHPAYAQGNWLGKVLQAVVQHLTTCAAGAVDWAGTLDTYEGVHAVPLMTIHKSKGLEYHTVIFVGLDDEAWRRSFIEDQVEATAGFFVAFTRAKQRVVFTYCARRGTRDAIATFYHLLLGAGVKIIEVP
jgi:superfamily I DNA/RNA helicase